MASFTYNDFRVVLKRAGFEHLRSEKHETWRKFLPNGSILRVRISHQHKRDIPKWLFHEMLRQAGLTLEEFRILLNSYPALLMKPLLQARIRGCNEQSRPSALQHTARVCLRASRLRVARLASRPHDFATNLHE